jgi:hypothetical protein
MATVKYPILIDDKGYPYTYVGQGDDDSWAFNLTNWLSSLGDSSVIASCSWSIDNGATTSNGGIISGTTVYTHVTGFVKGKIYTLKGTFTTTSSIPITGSQTLKLICNF